jgi:hypothetical protein
MLHQNIRNCQYFDCLFTHYVVMSRPLLFNICININYCRCFGSSSLWPIPHVMSKVFGNVKKSIDNSECFGVKYVKIYPEVTLQ